METIRDSYFETYGLLKDGATPPFSNGFTVDLHAAKAMAHEIAHQLIRENPREGEDDVDPVHRDAPPNLISKGEILVYDQQFFLHPLDVDYIRKLKLT